MKKLNQLLIRFWAISSIALVLSIIVFIFAFIFIRGGKSISTEFILSTPSGMPIGVDGGVFPAIIGSIYLFIIASIFASILALSTSIYLVFYCRNSKVDAIIHLVIECTAGIPSIVLGLFGYSLLVLKFNLGKSTLVGGIVLAIMIFPFIAVRVEKSLREISKEVVYSSYALGVSKTYTIFKVVLPSCKRDIIPAICQGGCFAMGAVAPVMFTSAVLVSPVPKTVMEPSMSLAYHLYILINEGISVENAYKTAFLLMIIILGINFVATIYAFRRRKY